MKTAMYRIWSFIAVSLWMIALVMRTVAGEFAAVNNSILAAAVVVSALLALGKREEIAKLVRNRRFKKAASSGLRLFLVLCVLGMANYLAVQHSRVFDLTAAKLHTLSEQSKKIAGSVEKETVLTLFAKRSDWERFLPLLRQYENENKLIKVKAVDVEENPALAKLNQVKESGTLTVSVDGKKIAGSAKSELKITNLLIKSLRQDSLTVYYTVGHGELDRDNENAPGGSYLHGVIQGANYELKPLDTIKLNEVPEDADAVMALGPEKGMMNFETDMLLSYLERGGNVFLLLGPDFEKKNLGNLRALTEARGIIRHNALVLDRLSAVQGANATIPVVNSYNSGHTITKNFSGRTLFPLSAALETPETEDFDVAVLAKSSSFPASWAESQLDDIDSGKVYYNKGLDLKGPVALMAVSEGKKDYGKLAVAASSDFVSNAYQNQSANFNLFMNTLAWLMDDEGIISLNRPELSDNMIILSAPQVSLIFYFSILFLPFAFFAVAVWVFRARANK